MLGYSAESGFVSVAHTIYLRLRSCIRRVHGEPILCRQMAIIIIIYGGNTFTNWLLF